MDKTYWLSTNKITEWREAGLHKILQTRHRLLRNKVLRVQQIITLCGSVFPRLPVFRDSNKLWMNSYLYGVRSMCHLIVSTCVVYMKAICISQVVSCQDLSKLLPNCTTHYAKCFITFLPCCLDFQFLSISSNNKVYIYAIFIHLYFFKSFSNLFWYYFIFYPSSCRARHIGQDSWRPPTSVKKNSITTYTPWSCECSSFSHSTDLWNTPFCDLQRRVYLYMWEKDWNSRLLL